MMKLRFLNFLICLLVVPEISYGQVFINGSFENQFAPTNSGNLYALSSSTFNTLVPNCYSLGPGPTAPNLDLVFEQDLFNGVSAPQHCLVSVGVTPADILALELTIPLIAGNTYTVSFFENYSTSSLYQPFALDIGVSNSLTVGTVGTVVYTTSGTGAAGVWMQRTFTFTSPINAQYITISNTSLISAASGKWTSVDRFIVGEPDNNVELGNDTTLCSGQSLLLDATIPNATFTWQDGSTDSVFSVTQAGTYWVEVNDGVSCDPLIDTIVVSYGQMGVDLGLDTTVCNGTYLVLDAGPGASTYLWNDNSTNQTLTINQSGTYYVEVSDGTAGCVGRDTIEVNFGTPPIISAGPDQSICQGMPVTLTGSGAPNLNWDNGVVDGVAFTPNTTSNYVLTGTSVEGCESTDTVQVTVTPGINVYLGQDVLDCTGGTITLDAQNPGSTYLWSDGSTNQTLDVTQSGTYFVEITNGACSTYDTIEVVIGTPPIVDAGPDQTICDGNSVTLTGSGAPNLTWDNTVVNGVPFTPTATTTYTLTGTSVQGCSNTDEVEVTVVSTPTPTITGNMDYCVGESVSLATGAGYQSYTWSNGASTQVAGPFTAANNPISVTVIDTNGCSGTSATYNLIEHNNPIVNLGPDAEICAGGTAVLDAQNPGANYLWSTGETTQTIDVSSFGTYYVDVTTTIGCSGSDTANVIVGEPSEVDAGPDQTICFGEEVVLAGTGTGVFMWNNDVHDNVPFVPNNTTLYTLTMIDANNCSNTDDVLITVEPLPEASFVYVPLELDITTPEATFTNTSLNASTYQWNFGEGGTSTEEHPNYEFQEPGTYQIQLIAISDVGCTDTTYAQLEVKDIPYFYVPNSFSPNGDGVNDRFYPVLSGRMPSEFELTIFNRWGEVIFQTDDHTASWDGTYKGSNCPIDSYVWLINMTDKDGVVITDYRGHLNLVR